MLQFRSALFLKRDRRSVPKIFQSENYKKSDGVRSKGGK